MVLVAVLSLPVSCKKKGRKLPLEKEKLVQILLDIYIAEGMAEVADLSVRDSVKSIYMFQVADKHKMTLYEMEGVLKKIGQMPDTLYMLQGMALDSLRNRQLKLKELENIGN